MWQQRFHGTLSQLAMAATWGGLQPKNLALKLRLHLNDARPKVCCPSQFIPSTGGTYWKSLTFGHRHFLLLKK